MYHLLVFTVKDCRLDKFLTTRDTTGSQWREQPPEKLSVAASLTHSQIERSMESEVSQDSAVGLIDRRPENPPSLV